jgi:hypothetical protein
MAGDSNWDCRSLLFQVIKDNGNDYSNAKAHHDHGTNGAKYYQSIL